MPTFFESSQLRWTGINKRQLLTLEPAHGNQQAISALSPINIDIVPLRRLRPDLPVDLETVIMKGMAVSRDERYATSKDFADDLRRVLEEKPTLARPPSIPERMAKWARRHRKLVAAAAVVGLFVMVGLAVGTVIVIQEKNRNEHNFMRAERYFREAQETVDKFGARLSERLAEIPQGASPTSYTEPSV